MKSATFELFYRELHSPSPRIMAEDGPLTGIQEIGHDDLDAFRPKVSPFFLIIRS